MKNLNYSHFRGMIKKTKHSFNLEKSTIIHSVVLFLLKARAMTGENTAVTHAFCMYFNLQSCIRSKCLNRR